MPTILYGWAGLEGLWVVASMFFLLWWLAIQHRMEHIEHEGTADVVNPDGKLVQLLDNEEVK